jgi:hypothetical protein
MIRWILTKIFRIKLKPYRTELRARVRRNQRGTYDD